MERKMERKSGSEQMNILLARMNQEGGFPISVLSDSQGLTIAFAAASGRDPERQSAAVAYMQKAATLVGRQLGMADPDEISFFGSDGVRLVCRPFDMEEYRLILAVLVPGRERTYRRITNFAMQEMRRIWMTSWKG
jgi:predicted regulator of Ras-like GTPase activity (Roadblock/LC7/MglB family)